MFQDCRNFEKKCPCQESELCKCGVGGECTGNVCSSRECTRILLTECDCPANVARNKCKTCCSFNGSCVPSITASEKLVQNNRLLIMSLKLFGNKKESLKFGYYRNFCHKSFCVELYFRETDPDGYCLVHGQVGICSKDLKCSVPEIKRIFPSLNVVNKAKIFVLFHPLISSDLFTMFICIICHMFY